MLKDMWPDVSNARQNNQCMSSKHDTQVSFLFMGHLLATNLTDEQRITSGFCLLHHGGLSVLGKELGMPFSAKP